MTGFILIASLILLVWNILITRFGYKKLIKIEKGIVDHDMQKEETDDPWRTKDTHKKN